MFDKAQMEIRLRAIVAAGPKWGFTHGGKSYSGVRTERKVELSNTEAGQHDNYRFSCDVFASDNTTGIKGREVLVGTIDKLKYRVLMTSTDAADMVLHLDLGDYHDAAIRSIG